MSVDRILLTNDDGIDAVGLRAMYDALSAEYEVVTVAPTGDRSSIGRAMSDEVDVATHELGYAVDGTPVDCVVAGLDELVPDADCVVAGCNKGANLGSYVLGRSGTVSAAVEAAFFGVPAVAASMYVPGDDPDWWRTELEPDRFSHAVRATRYLVDAASDAGVFETADYLNVNAPIADGDRPNTAAPMRSTTPSDWYGMTADHREGDETSNGSRRIGFDDPIWGRMTPEAVPDEVGTDRRAVVDGEVSVSPLTVPHGTDENGALGELVERYDGNGRIPANDGSGPLLVARADGDLRLGDNAVAHLVAGFVHLVDRSLGLVALDSKHHLVARRIDVGPRIGIDRIDALVSEHLVELLQRRLHARSEVASRLLIERSEEVVSDGGNALDEGLGGALADLVALALGSLLVVAEVGSDPRELAG